MLTLAYLPRTTPLDICRYPQHLKKNYQNLKNKILKKGKLECQQVIFIKTKKNNHFMGGKKVKEPSLFLHGQIRAGRSKKIKDKLIADLKNILVKKSKLNETQIWVYIVDLPSSQMIEYGAVLPVSGKEKEWFKNLSTKLKKKLSKLEK